VKQGRIGTRMKIRLCGRGRNLRSRATGTLHAQPIALQELEAGDVGFSSPISKQVADARMGDTIVEAGSSAPPFPALKPSSDGFLRAVFRCWPMITSPCVMRSATEVE